MTASEIDDAFGDNPSTDQQNLVTTEQSCRSYVDTFDPDDLEVVDGCLMTPDGQVVGTVEFEGIDEIAREETADAMMGRIAQVQAQLVACRMRRDAVIAQYAAMETQHQARLDYLNWRFRPLLEAYARHRLQFSKRRRSFDMPHGRLGFRKQAESVKITDMEKAVAFIRKIGLTDLITVKTAETVKARDAADIVADWGESVAPSEVDFLEVTPARDTFTLDTGLPG